jgi:hypothetical protein
MTRYFLTGALALSMLVPAAAAFAGHHEHGEMGEDHKSKAYKVDTNKDGMVSKDEFMAAHEKRFEKIDADSDGALSREELKASMKMRKEHMMQMKEKRGEMQDEDVDVDVQVEEE